MDDFLELVGPMWSVDQIKAQILDVVRETADVTSLLLEPNGNWSPHVAGQHVLLTVTIDGTAVTRTFSLSHAPGDRRALRLTIKAHPDGRVGGWVRDQARPGTVVTLSPPQGEFVLPTPAPPQLLFVTGGSGLTPLLAMAQSLVATGYQGDLCWVHCDGPDVALRSDMEAAIAALPAARLQWHLDPQRFLTREALARWVPDWASRELFVCGPRGLMELVEGMYAEAGRAEQVHSEDYQPRRRSPAPPAGRTASTVSFERSGLETTAQPGLSLLEQAERSGLHPAYGCRRGICHTCKCTKRSGTVRNDITGELHDGFDEEIRLCIHTPIGHVRLDL